MSRMDLTVFLDRDGVINVPPPPEERYITRPEDFALMPGIADAIRALNQRNIPVAVVTNQKCIAIGRLEESMLWRIHDRMEELLKQEQAHVDTIRYCPHQESDNCTCRKPLPGMIFDAALELGVSPDTGWMVGDQPRDILAGKAAGCRTVWIHEGEDSGVNPDVTLPCTRDLVPWIEENLPFQQKEGCNLEI